MTSSTTPALDWRVKYPFVQYVAPFAIFVLLLMLAPHLGVDARWELPGRVLLLGVVCFICWPRELPFSLSKPVASVLIGLGVFLIWIGPDLLFPGYRQSILFSNSLFGQARSSLQLAELHDPWVLGWRTARAVLIVPIVEELFWRAWLMRWLINANFERVPLGAYRPAAFWVTAVLFASEHGPYWEVGLITGVIYNLWMIRTKSIADCIVMHAVTNAVLSVYVISTAQWQYWL